MDSPANSLSLVEIELAVLARTLEGLTRRSQIHRELDRSSYLIARMLDTDGRTNINGLAARLGLDATTVTRQVATMEADGLVVRHADANDRRVSLIELSPRGRRLMTRVRQAREARMDELLEGWSETERRDFGRLLERFNVALLGRDRETAASRTR